MNPLLRVRPALAVAIVALLVLAMRPRGHQPRSRTDG